MTRLSEIAFRLPRTLPSRVFLGHLRTLLADVAYAEATGSAPVERLTLTPPHPAGARPVTTVELDDVSAPEIAFDTGLAIGVEADRSGARVLPAAVEMAELVRRLAGHVRRIDHTGVNLPAGTTTPAQWRSLVQEVAATSAMYRYPTGEDWPFVLPATPDELRGDIRGFVVGREPRFELVHDPWLTRPTWQFALGTDLSRAELERLFPEPDGITLPGLEEVFRVVAVHHPWPDLGVRFDLCYRLENGPSDWETGEWLVTEGGRIR